MKKSTLILLTFVPIIAGYFINITLMVPVVGTIVFYIVPYLVLAFWFYLGSQYAKTNWGAIPSVLIGSATGILSLGLYLWQFLGQSSETRNMILAGFSQMYTAATPGYLLAGVAMMFESQPNYFGTATMVALQVLSIVLMIVIFTAGYFWEKKRSKRNG